MRELMERVSNESNFRPAAGVRQEHNFVPLEKKVTLEIKGKRRILSSEPTEQKNKREAGDKIYDIKRQLSALTRE